MGKPIETPVMNPENSELSYDMNLNLIYVPPPVSIGNDISYPNNTIQYNEVSLNSFSTFRTEDLQNFNFVLPQYVYCPPPMEFYQSSCAFCQHIKFFNQAVPNIQNVNFAAVPSVDQFCADLPFLDKPTLQYFYNLGLEFSQGSCANAVNNNLNKNTRNKKGRKSKKYFK